MANDVKIDGGRTTAKVRNPWLVLLFGVLTFGIYFAFWWYFANREMADLGRERKVDYLGDEPGLSVLAYTLGSIVWIPWIWTVVATSRRAQRAVRLTTGESFNGWLLAAVAIVTFGLAVPVYLQHKLNKAWRARGMEPVSAEDVERGNLPRREKLNALFAAGAITEAEHEAEQARLGLAAD